MIMSVKTQPPPVSSRGTSTGIGIRKPFHLDKSALYPPSGSPNFQGLTGLQKAKIFPDKFTYDPLAKITTKDEFGRPILNFNPFPGGFPSSHNNPQNRKGSMDLKFPGGRNSQPPRGYTSSSNSSRGQGHVPKKSPSESFRQFKRRLLAKKAQRKGGGGGPPHFFEEDEEEVEGHGYHPTRAWIPGLKLSEKRQLAQLRGKFQAQALEEKSDDGGGPPQEPKLVNFFPSPLSGISTSSKSDPTDSNDLKLSHGSMGQSQFSSSSTPKKDKGPKKGKNKGPGPEKSHYIEEKDKYWKMLFQNRKVKDGTETRFKTKRDFVQAGPPEPPEFPPRFGNKKDPTRPVVERCAQLLADSSKFNGERYSKIVGEGTDQFIHSGTPRGGANPNNSVQGHHQHYLTTTTRKDPLTSTFHHNLFRTPLFGGGGQSSTSKSPRAPAPSPRAPGGGTKLHPGLDLEFPNHTKMMEMRKKIETNYFQLDEEDQTEKPIKSIFIGKDWRRPLPTGDGVGTIEDPSSPFGGMKLSSVVSQRILQSHGIPWSKSKEGDLMTPLQAGFLAGLEHYKLSNILGGKGGEPLPTHSLNKANIIKDPTTGKSILKVLPTTVRDTRGPFLGFGKSSGGGSGRGGGGGPVQKDSVQINWRNPKYL